MSMTVNLQSQDDRSPRTWITAKGQKEVNGENTNLIFIQKRLRLCWITGLGFPLSVK